MVSAQADKTRRGIGARYLLLSGCWFRPIDAIAGTSSQQGRASGAIARTPFSWKAAIERPALALAALAVASTTVAVVDTRICEGEGNEEVSDVHKTRWK